MQNPSGLFNLLLLELSPEQDPEIFSILDGHFNVRSTQPAQQIFNLTAEQLPDAILCPPKFKQEELFSFLGQYQSHPLLFTIPIYIIHKEPQCKEIESCLKYGVIDCFSIHKDLNEVVPKIRNLLNLCRLKIQHQVQDIKSTIRNSIERMNLIIKDNKPDQSSFQQKINHYDLTERESEIIKLILNHFSNKEIAQELNISFHTVNNHLKNIFSKMKINKRIDLIQLFIKPD